MTIHLGIDCLLADPAKLQQLSKARVALVAHPASVTGGNEHSLDALIQAGCNVIQAFGPQHGMRGEKQDNMIETEDYHDPRHGLPVISLYGEHRRPTPEMLEDIDIVLFDLQDIGCRIYTYITTLYYFCEVCAALGKELWVLDRPNPAGRPVDGLYLLDGEQSFVGSAPMPTRHGLTIGELAAWFSTRVSHDGSLPLSIIQMVDYNPAAAPGYGWPINERAWVNPSPNAASVNMARCFPGTVLLEGTTLSEGRGTTIPLEVIGAPDWPVETILNELEEEVPDWLRGIYLRQCFFMPTFHKHVDMMCSGLQMHTDAPGYQHEAFKPYRLIAGLLKATRKLLPDYDLWRYHDYEYELDRKPIDVINGGPALRNWVDDPSKSYTELQAALSLAETDWLNERDTHLLYP